jgi:hypothetical protein
MRSTRCFEPMQNPTPSMELFGCSARYHEQVNPRVRLSLIGRPSRERTTFASVPFVMPSTDLVRDDDCTPRPMWMTSPDEVTWLLDPQPATAAQSTTKRTAERFKRWRYTAPRVSKSRHAQGSFRNTGPAESPAAWLAVWLRSV